MSSKRGSRMDTPQDRICRELMFLAGSIRNAQLQLSIALDCVHKAMETCTPYAGEYGTYAGKYGTYGSIFTDPADMEDALAWMNDQAAQAQVEIARIPKSVLSIRYLLTELDKKEESKNE